MVEEIVCIDKSSRQYEIKAYYMISWGNEKPSYPNSWETIIQNLFNDLGEKYTLQELKNDPVVRAYRQFYWRIGIDPTKTRPSSEALVRRILKKKFPKISPIVDAGNVASAYYLVPIGLYDLDKVSLPLRFTVSKGGEQFYGIGGKDETLSAGIPILVDSGGKVLHLYPHRDSRLTMITESTRRLLAVAAGVPGVEDSRLIDTLKYLRKLFALLGWSSDNIRIVEEC